MLGFASVSAAAVLWAVGATYARGLIDRGAEVAELTAARAWIAMAGLGLFMLLRRKPASSVGLLVIPFGLALTAANFFYYLAISRLPVAVAVVVQYTAPAMVVLYTALQSRRRPSRRTTAALLIAFAGVILISGMGRESQAGSLDSGGLAAAIISAVGFATYVVLGEKLGEKMGIQRTTFWGFVVASVFWTVAQLQAGTPRTLINPEFIPGVLFLGVATTIAPFSLFLWGVQRVGSSAAGIVSTLEPVAAAVLAYLWLGQSLEPMRVVGAAAVVLGIAIVQSERRPEAISEIPPG